MKRIISVVLIVSALMSLCCIGVFADSSVAHNDDDIATYATIMRLPILLRGLVIWKKMAFGEVPLCITTRRVPSIAFCLQHGGIAHRYPMNFNAEMRLCRMIFGLLQP